MEKVTNVSSAFENYGAIMKLEQIIVECEDD